MLTVRPTAQNDLSAVSALEAGPDTGRWLADRSPAWHRAALQDPDQEHVILLDDGRIAGFAVLAGTTSPHHSIELRRLVLGTEHRGRGLGRQGLRALTAWGFDDAGAHPVWLDVKEANTRARTLYRARASSARACYARRSARTTAPGPPWW